MNYLSGDNKSILGKRLSSRYLSSDAFTSSAGKITGRSISRLGSMFGRNSSHTKAKRFSGTGQRIGLFELKNIFVKIIIVITACVVLGYTIPYTRYAVHRFFVKHTVPFSQLSDTEKMALSSDVATLASGEYYVSPVFGKTDRFVVNLQQDSLHPDMHGLAVYGPLENGSKRVLLGMLDFASSTKPYVALLSEVGQKNNLFIREVEQTEQPVSTSTDATGTASQIIPGTKETMFVSAVFEGFGYGQLRAQVPPQQHVDIDTILYARTEQGLMPAARVSYVEKDTASTFTNIYAQLLVPPFEIYKVYVDDMQK